MLWMDAGNRMIWQVLKLYLPLEHQIDFGLSVAALRALSLNCTTGVSMSRSTMDYFDCEAFELV